MKLSENFDLAQFTTSQTAIRKNIDNTPPPEVLFSLEQLCNKVLEPLLKKGFKFSINSGYRSPALNKAIGGAKDSQHTKGQAADLNPIGLSVEDLYTEIIKSQIPFDQIIQEFNSWVHISYKSEPRLSKLRAIKVNGKTVYTPDNKFY